MTGILQIPVISGLHTMGRQFPIPEIFSAHVPDYAFQMFIFIAPLLYVLKNEENAA